MKRSVGVLVIAVIALFGSVLALGMGILMVVVAVAVPMPSRAEFPLPPAAFRALMGLVSLFYLLPAGWGIASGIGLFRMKNWARVSTIVFSILLILMGAFSFLMFLVIPTFPNQPSLENIDSSLAIMFRVLTCLFELGLCGIGIWWLVYLTRPKVKGLFLQPPALALATMPPTYLGNVQAVSTQPAPVAPAKPERPLSFTILAIWLLVCCGFLPLALALRPPVFLFTWMLTGWSAAIYTLLLTAVLLYIGVGLLRFKLPARPVALVYFGFALLNSAVFFLAPGRADRIHDLMERQQNMFPWLAPFRNAYQPAIDYAPLIVVGACGGFALTVFIMYLLVTRRQAFELAARARQV